MWYYTGSVKQAFTHFAQALRIKSSHFINNQMVVVTLPIFRKGGVFTLVDEVPGVTDLSPLLSSTETCTLTESVVQTGLEGGESTRKYSLFVSNGY